MKSDKLIVHTHHISSHFTNALWPVGFLLLFSYFLTGKEAYESASFYMFIIGTLATPFTFGSGIIDWKTKYKGRSTRIFNHKRFFGMLFLLFSVVIVLWRFIDPSLATSANTHTSLYFALVFINCGFVSYLGHLGGKFI